ncbi:tRNA nucleotidyltransferase cca2 [Lolium perenne]|uniref:tRNA nucleotidyltransferase cca2 n=1 Tax=Lolium perenne TaxID=4522 RepID=UPI0021F5EAEB|nr:tRNA nucleotidyltransferase cca2-like [Lolium perenne]
MMDSGDLISPFNGYASLPLSPGEEAQTIRLGDGGGGACATVPTDCENPIAPSTSYERNEGKQARLRLPMDAPNKAQGDLPIGPSAAHRDANNSWRCSKRVLRVVRGGGAGNSGNSAMRADSLEQLQRGAEVVETVVIELTEEEEKIFQRLLDVVRHFDLCTTLRVAGGWVRDKLLGEQPADIDIALDNNMTGLEFSVKYTEFLVEKKLTVGEKQQEKGKKLEGGTNVIRCNPDRSKHLETVKMSVLGRDIDFVNLRSETYVESTRIPTMKSGTAEQDAYRRDLTINSLFYNINDNCVEDFTRRGIDDLKKGLIVTPLDPKATFLDDPLRVLRAIRFATRFNFTLSDELKEAASDEKVKLELCCKISRERVGEEINHMMSGRRPVEAMSYICDLGLFYVAFAFPEKSNPPNFDNYDRCCVSHIEAAWNFAISLHNGVSHPLLDEQRQLYLYSALFFPLRKMFYLDEKSKKIEVTRYIVKESLKLPACLAKSVVDIHAASGKFAEFLLLFESNVASGTLKEELEDVYLELPTDTLNRVYAGVILSEIKDFWRVALAISILYYYPEAENALSQQDRLKEKYMEVEHFITDLGLDEVWNWKPLLKGETIMAAMQRPKGPEIGEWKKRVFRWQLAHPNGTVDDCIDWMKQSQSKRQKLEI